MTKRERLYHSFNDKYRKVLKQANSVLAIGLRRISLLEDDQIDYCEHCSGTGEGRADGLSCNYCVNGVKRKMKDREPN